MDVKSIVNWKIATWRIFIFKDGSPQTFSYEIIANAQGYRLIVTDSEGNFAMYEDTIFLGMEEELKSAFTIYPNTRIRCPSHKA